MTEDDKKKIARAKDFLVRAKSNKYDSRSKRALIEDAITLLGYLGKST